MKIPGGVLRRGLRLDNIERTEPDSEVTPSLGMGTVYVSMASSPTTSMPSTKLRMRLLRSRNVPSRKELPEVRHVSPKLL